MNTEDSRAPHIERDSLAAGNPPVDPGEYSAIEPGRILVVEDNPVNQMLASRLLLKLGFVADVAENGIEALKKLKLTHYSLILMDLQMPLMDGLEATRCIRTLGIEDPLFKVPIVALTTCENRKLCLEAGMDDFLSKPLHLSLLRECLERFQSLSKSKNGRLSQANA